MELISTNLQGVFIIKSNLFTDVRGMFLKTFHKTTFEKLGLETNFVEHYYSTSHKDVIRGMHFQIPPHDHVKMVNVLHGKITDVVLDIRKESPTFGQHLSLELNDHDGLMLYIPKGCAHGFKSLVDGTIVEYRQTSEYNKDADSGILWNSFGFDWEIHNAVISERDQSFVEFKHFKSPF